MFQRMLRYTRNFFSFSYAEAKGFLLMAGLLLIFFLTYLLYRQWPSEGYTSYIEDKALLDSLVRQMEALEKMPSSTLKENYYKGSREEEEAAAPPQFFVFDPNRLPVDSLQLLGIPQWLARRIVNFREKGGRFRKKEDLMVIYDMPDSLYQSLRPFIQLPPDPVSPPGARAEKPERREDRPVFKEKTVAAFDINQADSLLLQEVKGIGPVLSSRIVKFREKLGGFVSMDQLYEVWGLDSTVVEKLGLSAFIDGSFRPEQLNINEASQEEIAAHPYFSPMQARLIYAYRQQHGAYQSVNDLLNIHTLDSSFVKKVSPYIVVKE